MLLILNSEGSAATIFAARESTPLFSKLLTMMFRPSALAASQQMKDKTGNRAINLLQMLNSLNLLTI